MALCFKRQSSASVLTPAEGSVCLFVDPNGLPSVKDSNGLVTLLVALVPGPAGGDLSGNYPNPSVIATPALRTATGTVVVSGSIAPESGQVLTALSANTANWQDVQPSEPSGAAGGDLAGAYPNPIARRTGGLQNASTTVSTSGSDAPEFGQVLAATSDSTATWQVLASTMPDGPAGGNLSGSYPNPIVDASASLRTLTTQVSTVASLAPTVGQLLVAASGVSASWHSPSVDFGGTWSAPSIVQARGVKTATTTVNVAGAAAPVSGQILTALSPTAAYWKTPDVYVRNEIMDPPLVPDLADQEFTVDPFLSGAWLVTDGIHVAQTRSGEVTPASQPLPGEYRSTLSGSTVFVQTSMGSAKAFLMPVASPSSGSQLWMGGFGAVTSVGPQASASVYGMYILADSGGLPDFSNSVVVAHHNRNSQGVTGDLQTYVVVNGVLTEGELFSSDAMGVNGFSGMLVRKDEASSVTFGYFTPHGELATFGVPLTCFPGPWAWAGFFVNPNLGNGDPSQMWGGITALHFMRRKLSADAYIFG